jgi:hypothetical protein
LVGLGVGEAACAVTDAVVAVGVVVAPPASSPERLISTAAAMPTPAAARTMPATSKAVAPLIPAVPARCVLLMRDVV